MVALLDFRVCSRGSDEWVGGGNGWLRTWAQLAPGRLQDFPYHLLPGIEHHNLWATHILTPYEIEEVGRLKGGCWSGF